MNIKDKILSSIVKISCTFLLLVLLKPNFQFEVYNAFPVNLSLILVLQQYQIKHVISGGLRSVSAL